jgi:hypothetical protein
VEALLKPRYAILGLAYDKIPYSIIQSLAAKSTLDKQAEAQIDTLYQ